MIVNRTPIMLLALGALVAPDVASAAPATGPTPVRTVGPVTGTSLTGPVLASAGERWVLWHDGTQWQRFDDRDGRRARLEGVKQCDDSLRPSIVVSTRGTAVIQCWRSEGVDRPVLEHHVFDPGSGVAHRMPGPLPRDSFTRVGRHWAEGSVDPDSTRTANLVLVNWRTGERLTFETDGCFDLDSATPKALSARTCSNLGTVLRDGKDGLRHARGPGGRDLIDALRGHRRLARVNRVACRAVHRCSMRLGAGWGTSARVDRGRPTVSAYDYRGGRLHRWRLPAVRSATPSGDHWLAVTHVRRFLFVAVPAAYETDSWNGTYVSRYRLLRARLPKRP